MTRGRAAAERRPARGEAGGIWIATGFVLGALLYAGIVLMAIAGFTAVVPLVVVPPVVAALIAGSNLLGGRPHRPVPTEPVARVRAPLSSSGPNGPRRPTQPAETGTDAPA